MPSACGDDEPALIVVKKNGVEIASYTAANAEGDKLVQTEGSALLLTNGVITGVVATAGNEGDAYQVEVTCPNGSKTTTGATLGADPFPTAKLLWFYDASLNGADFVSSIYMSVEAAPYVVTEYSPAYPSGYSFIYVGLSGGGTGYFQAAPGIYEIRLTRIRYAEIVTGNTISSYAIVVSENTL